MALLLKSKPYLWSQLLLGLMAILTFAPNQGQNATLNQTTCVTQYQHQEQNLLQENQVKEFQYKHSLTLTSKVKKLTQIIPTFFKLFIFKSSPIRAGPLLSFLN